jgi:hypothetical protein
VSILESRGVAYDQRVNKWLVISVALLVMIGPSAYFVIRKHTAAASVEAFLRDGFRERATAPIARVGVPRGGSFGDAHAWEGQLADGRRVVVLVGLWSRGMAPVNRGAMPVYQRVAGVLVPSLHDAAWTERWRDPDVLVAAATDDGALVVWEGLPSAASLRAHLADVARRLP